MEGRQFEDNWSPIIQSEILTDKRYVRYYY